MEEGRIRGRLELRVTARAASLGQIRRLLGGFLAEHDFHERQRQDALIVVNELAANAIEHASTDEDQLEIAVRLERETLLIRVLDPARTATRPSPLWPDMWRECGRGMLIVDELASWSDELVGDRRAVTARLTLSHEAAKRSRS